MGKFQVGQIVQLLADPTRQGSVIDILPIISGKERYRIFHGVGDIRDYLGEQLVSIEKNVLSDNLLISIQKESWLPLDEFQARLTAARLMDPQIDQIYSLFAGRIQYIPFQFKPLLRFLRADQSRLFIADEVGVGKTIEAGLILKELEARQRLQNVLVLCPKALVYKWREELRRFDEDFRILSSENLRYCLNETHYDGFWPQQYSKSIVHMELFRQVQYLEGIQRRRIIHRGLKMLQPPPKFDLLIVDEAHHLRNPGTLTNQLAQILCENSNSVLFLSATPVHIGSINLFNLLNLLRPELFTDKDVFDQVVEPNRFVTRAMHSIRSNLPADSWQKEAADSIQKIKTTAWGAQVIQQDPIFIEWDSRLSNGVPLSDNERVRCLRDLEEIHSLSHIINRTRRRDIGRFTIREPQTITVPFTELQQEFYDAIIDFRREMMLQEYNPAIAEMICITLQRQAASCLPALIPLLDTFIQSGKFSAARVSDDPENEDNDEDLPNLFSEKAKVLKTLAAKMTRDDPKLDLLLNLINASLRFPGKKKILLFSYFLHTLHYLKNHLSALGIRVELITGKTKEEDREDIRSRFRLPFENIEAIDILLSSEVGCEGLDYEFCDRMVNYDIPWNPMRIEQRIGRIDRFGQNSEKVLIYNFITPGTVEERIFFRCFERLGIFKDTIGDLEEVLGEVVEDLTKIALDNNLTKEQAQEKARQVSDNLIRLVDEEHRLEEESTTFLGINESFTSDIQKLVEEGKFVSADDLIRMVDFFVKTPEMGGKLTKDDKNIRIYRLRLRKESRQIIYEWLQDAGYTDKATIVFKRWLQGDEPIFKVTFDQQTALEDRQLPFITPVHPLIRATVAFLKEKTMSLIASIKVVDNRFQEGIYVFVCELWDFLGVRSETKLISLCWDVNRSIANDELSEKIVGLINKSSNSMNIQEHIDFDHIFRKIEEEMMGKRQIFLTKHIERNEYLLNRKVASLDAWYQGRIKKLDFEIPRIIDERILRMKEAERFNVGADYESKLAKLENKRVSDITTRRVAAGILEVINDK
jgi:superfamily II DNA or RNA helicase